MPFDALTVAAVRHELQQKVLGGRVQGIVATAPLTISLEIYRSGVGRTHLILSAHPQHARVYLSPGPVGRDPSQQPTLLLLLRKYVRGGTIVDIHQPPHERVLGVSIAKRLGPGKHQEYHSDPYFMHNANELEVVEGAAEEATEGEPVTVELIIELMGRLSNIVLVADDGTVMESIKRIPASLNRYRVTLPNHPYKSPPPQEKRDPQTATANALSLELRKVAESEADAPAWKGLVAGFVGVSPALAREAVFRALGIGAAGAATLANRASSLDAILRELRALLSLEETGAWEPTVAWKADGEGAERARDFAPYPLTHLEAGGARLEAVGSISEAVELYYASQLSEGRYAALKSQVRSELTEIRGRDERRLGALNEQLERSEAADLLRRKGEYLLAFMHTLEPGQRTLHLPDEGLTIELDPSLSPVENSQAYFRDYHKARSAQEGLPRMVEEAQMRVRLLDEITTSLDLAESHEDIRAVQAELELVRYPTDRRPAEAEDSPKKQTKGRAKAQQTKLSQPLRVQTARGATILVGRTARQNEAATFRLASPDDLWFHARNLPGAHVILKAAGSAITDEEIEEAAAYAAGYSSARQEAQVDVVYTERRYVRKIAGAPPGLVTYKNETLIRAAPKRL